jgi:hypothetical protein
MPGLVKIGKTSRIVEELVKDLNTTGVPASFKIAHQRKVEHMDQVERDMHQHFNRQRENRDREFFNIATDEAIAYLDRFKEAPGETERAATEITAGERSEATRLVKARIAAARPTWRDSESKRRFNKLYAELLVCERELVDYGVDFVMNETIFKGTSYQVFKFTPEARHELARLETEAVCGRADFENGKILQHRRRFKREAMNTAMRGLGFGEITVWVFVILSVIFMLARDY